jgi:hypothetical protein
MPSLTGGASDGLPRLHSDNRDLLVVEELAAEFRSLAGWGT